MQNVWHTRLNRRRVLGALAGGALGLSGGSAGARADTPSVTPSADSPVTADRRRAVVIGSGFGGGIAALRLAQAGVPALVLERGIRWPTGPGADTFPRLFYPDRRCAWLSPTPVLTGSPPAVFAPYTGVLERVPGIGMSILCGAGVGGSSLVYHGMTLQPNENNFTQSMPASVPYHEMVAEYYPRIAKALAVATIPDDVLDSPNYLSSRLFLRHTAHNGLPTSRIPLPVDWEYARGELRGEMTPSYTTGDVIYGVNNGGKSSVDVVYVAPAEATGLVEVAILHVVRDIAMDAAGRWVVHVDRIDTHGRVQERKEITTDALFLGAGSAGTTRLLVKARAKGLIPDLPDGVGTRWGNNGDRIYAWLNAAENTGAYQGGPACVGSLDWNAPDRAVSIVHGPVPIPYEAHVMSLIGFGVVRGSGRFTYDPLNDDAVLTWPPHADAGLARAIRSRLDRLVASAGGVLVDTTAVDPTTYHPLGGAVIDTVCDPYGRVLGHRGLYVTDGSLVPGSTGACNPSMTIAALAERCMDTILREDAGIAF